MLEKRTNTAPARRNAPAAAALVGGVVAGTACAFVPVGSTGGLPEDISSATTSLRGGRLHVHSQQSNGNKWAQSGLVVASAACALSMKLRSNRRVAMASAASTPEASKGSVNPLEIIGAVLLALLDIFKPPPEESTGKDAPGLVALGSEGVLGALRGCTIQNVRDGSFKDPTELSSPLDAVTGARTVLMFATHFGDFNSWEEAQQLRTAVKQGRLDGVRVALIGIGTMEAGTKFCEYLELPADIEVYADPKGACHDKLGFSKGAFPEYAEQLNAYVRVFFMLLGVGSPGTLVTVLGGYFGNTSLSKENVSWVDEALKQGAKQGRFPTTVPARLPWEEKKEGEPEMADLATVGSGVWDGRGFGEAGLRPFELATVRLQNMVSGIIQHWDELKPPDDELLVQQGGAVVLGADGQAEYFYRDKGILTYAPVQDVLGAARGNA